MYSLYYEYLAVILVDMNIVELLAGPQSADSSSKYSMNRKTFGGNAHFASLQYNPLKI